MLKQWTVRHNHTKYNRRKIWITTKHIQIVLIWKVCTLLVFLLLFQIAGVIEFVENISYAPMSYSLRNRTGNCEPLVSPEPNTHEVRPDSDIEVILKQLLIKNTSLKKSVTEMLDENENKIKEAINIAANLVTRSEHEELQATVEISCSQPSTPRPLKSPTPPQTTPPTPLAPIRIDWNS